MAQAPLFLFILSLSWANILCFWILDYTIEYNNIKAGEVKFR